jgi:hypothetical protein
MKKLLLFSLLIVFSVASMAQYKNSLGLAFGNPSGIAYKTFISNNKALDFTLGGFDHYFSLNGMYEIHTPLGKQFQWYYGPGAHIGSWNGGKYGRGVFLGIDGALGIEFNPSIPFAFSLDIRPALNLVGNDWDNEFHWFWWQSQFAVRYVF